MKVVGEPVPSAIPTGITGDVLSGMAALLCVSILSPISKGCSGYGVVGLALAERFFRSSKVRR